MTNATLSGRLKDLEEAGLIERRLYQERPERHDYVPTDKGRDIALVMQAMVQVGDKWRQKEKQGAPLLFVDGTSGHQVRLALRNTERAVPEPGIKIKAGPGADDLMKWRLSRGESERISRSEVSSKSSSSV